ncbi:hypothetical protein GY45DRAFT_435833 [Cubamyces sp. BRFM 1775]|nr:hypothetical protein GY45DRAFT_435833 [Cubamyces sp. BRFM 1775]
MRRRRGRWRDRARERARERKGKGPNLAAGDNWFVTVLVVRSDSAAEPAEGMGKRSWKRDGIKTSAAAAVGLAEGLASRTALPQAPALRLPLQIWKHAEPGARPPITAHVQAPVHCGKYVPALSPRHPPPRTPRSRLFGSDLRRHRAQATSPRLQPVIQRMLLLPTTWILFSAIAPSRLPTFLSVSDIHPMRVKPPSIGIHHANSKHH